MEDWAIILIVVVCIITGFIWLFAIILACYDRVNYVGWITILCWFVVFPLVIVIAPFVGIIYSILYIYEKKKEKQQLLVNDEESQNIITHESNQLTIPDQASSKPNSVEEITPRSRSIDAINQPEVKNNIRKLPPLPDIKTVYKDKPPLGSIYGEYKKPDWNNYHKSLGRPGDSDSW